MSENFCLQPYHIGERLLACFFNRNKEIVKNKFKITDFEYAIPEKQITFAVETETITVDAQHKIDIVLKAGEKVYAVELKLGLHDKKNAKKTYRNFFEKKYWCCIQKRKNKEYLKGNMCCLLSRLWEPKTSSKDLYINEDEKTLKVDLESWFLIVRNNSIKDMLPKKDHCTILSLEEIINGHENDFMNCIRECVVLPTVDDYLSKWGLAKMEK